MKGKEFMDDNKIYVFLSHSHLDYEKVRMVRDLLENEGFRPLMFFLKCLERKDYKELTEKLIKEEIDNRQRFILCESDNAKKSEWVDFEIKHIRESKRPYTIVNIDGTENDIKDVLKEFKIRSSVFLSCPRSLFSLAEATCEELRKHDFLPLGCESLVPGSSYEQQMRYSIADAAQNGYVLVFVGEKISEFQYREIQGALKWRARIIPIITTHDLSILKDRFLGSFQAINISNMSINESAKRIVEQLIKKDLEYYENQMINE